MCLTGSRWLPDYRALEYTYARHPIVAVNWQLAAPGEGERMAKRRLRGLIIVGVLACLLGLLAFWFSGAPPWTLVESETVRHAGQQYLFAQLVALFGALMTCFGLVVILAGAVGLVLLVSRPSA